MLHNSQIAMITLKFCIRLLMTPLMHLYILLAILLLVGITILDVDFLTVRSLICSYIIDTKDTPLYSLLHTVFGLLNFIPTYLYEEVQADDIFFENMPQGWD